MEPSRADPESAGDRRVRRSRRLLALGLLAAVVVAGLAVHGALPDVAATDIAGDALYAAAAYLAIVVVAPRLSPLVVGVIAAAWCVGVELFQLTGLPLAWGAVFTPAMLVFGTVFDPRDLAVYLVTVAIAAGVDAGVRAVRRSRR